MAVVPTIPGSSRVATPANTVKMDAGALDAPNRARAYTGHAAAQVGQQLAQYGQEIQRAVNYGLAADADREMRQAAAEFQSSRAGRTDEDQWQSEWQDKSTELLTRITEKSGVGPALKRQLIQNWKDWQMANAIEVQTMANKQRINRAVERVGLDADEAARDGDSDQIESVFEGAVANGLMMPEVAEKAKLGYLTKIDEYAAKTFILNNPASAVDFLEEKDANGKPVNLKRLTPDDRLSLVNSARIQFTKYQEQNLQGLIEGLQGGEVRTPVELQALVAQKVISPKQRKSYEAAYRFGSYNTDVGSIGELFTAINAYDPKDDPKFTKRAELMAKVATSGYPQNVQSEMNQLLGNKSDAKNILNSPVAKDAFEAIDQRFRLGLYGKYETKIEDKDGNFKTVVNPGVYESAMTTKRRIEDATRRFLNQKPDATAEEVNRFVADMQMGEVVKTGRIPVLNSLGVNAPASAMTAGDRKAKLDAILAKDKK